MTEQTQEITQPIEPIQQVPVESKKKSNLPAIVILLVVILLVGVGGVYAGMQISKKQTPVVMPTAPPPEVRPTETLPTPISDETASWKTYKNEEDGFEFKYPSNLKVRGDTGIIQVVQKQSKNSLPDPQKIYTDEIIGITVWNNKQYNPQSLSLLEYLKYYGLDQTYSSKIAKFIQIGNRNGILSGSLDGCEPFICLKNIMVHAPNNTYFIKVIDRGSDGTDKISDQILSTFKFTN